MQALEGALRREERCTFMAGEVELEDSAEVSVAVLAFCVNATVQSVVPCVRSRVDEV